MHLPLIQGCGRTLNQERPDVAGCPEALAKRPVRRPVPTGSHGLPVQRTEGSGSSGGTLPPICSSRRSAGAPIVTVASAAKLIGRTYQAINEGIEKLRARAF